jgi:glycine/sarcosine N-methyltransferase
MDRPGIRRLRTYGELGDRFDALFEDIERLSAIEAASLDAVLKQHDVHTVLDCACGTGIQAIGLAQIGYEVVASDISSRMVAVLTEKAEARGLRIPTRRQDFRSLQPWRGLSIDAVICCGESLPLVPTRDDVHRALARMVAVASATGSLVIVGIRNYAMLGATGQEFYLHRPYRRESGLVAFDARIFRGDTVDVVQTIGELHGTRWQFTSVAARHLCLTPFQLRDAMLQAGCVDVELRDANGISDPAQAEWVMAVGQTPRRRGSRN